MLLQQIRDAALAARKAAFGPAAEPQWRKDLLVTLLSEAEMFGKNEANRESTDEEVIGVIKKFLKNITDAMDSLAKINVAHGDLRVVKLLFEREVLTSLLPKQLTEEELRTILTNQAAAISLHSMKQMGDLMKPLRDNYTGLFDGKMAAAIAKELIAKVTS